MGKYNTEEERKAAKAARNKQWREKNPDYDKQRYQDKKEERAAYLKQWREQNPDYMKCWYADHKAEIAARMKRYYTNNKEERAAYQKQYNSSPFGRAVYLASNYRAADKKAGRDECTITPEWILDNVLSGQCCHYCGESDWTKLGVDRKDSNLPHTPENCVPCCQKCNAKKKTVSYEEYIKKVS